MFSDSSKAAQRSFQAGFDFHQSRRNRLDVSLSLRKRCRHERLQRKRRALGKPRSNASNNDQNKENNPNSNNTNKNKKEESPNVKNLGKYVPLIFSNDDKQRVDGVVMIRILLSQEREAPISQVVETGVIPRLISYIDPNENRNNDRLRHESLWCLTNIASGPTEFVEKIVTLGAIDAICKVLQCTSNSEVASQAIWALGNIVGDDPKYGQQLLKSNLMQFCTNAWKGFDTQIQKETAWVICNLCRTHCKNISISNYSHREMVENKKHCLPLIADLIDINKHVYYTEGEVEEYSILSKYPNAKSDNILYDLLWAISNLTDEESLPSELTGSFVNIIARNEEYNIVPKMIHILHKECKNFQNIINSKYLKINNNSNKNVPSHNKRRYLIEKTKNLKRLGQPCHRALGNLLTGDDDIAQVVLDAGYLDVATIMIDYPIPTIRRETLWALSNITAGTDEQLLMVVNNDRLFARISEIALECGNYLVAKEALWCISNAISTGSNEIKQKAVNYGAMKILIRFLTKPFVCGQKEMLAALEGMDYLLSVYGAASEYKQNDDDNDNNMNDGNNNNNGFLNNYDYVVQGFNKWADEMEELGGLDCLEEIQSDETTSDEVFEKAQEIVKKYWPNDDIIDGAGDDSKGGTYDANYFKPKQVNNMFVFGFGNGNGNNNNGNNGNNGGNRFGSNVNGNNRNNSNNSNNNNNSNNGNNNGNRTNLWSF